MARPAVEGTPEQWQRVADLVRQRRHELDLLGREIEALGVSKSALSLIENNHQTRYERRNLRKLSTALRWTPDSIERILAGDAPTESVSDTPLARVAPADFEGRYARLSPDQKAIVDALFETWLPEEGD